MAPTTRTNMKIEKSLPPNFEKIAKHIPQAHGHGVIFAYGDTIFNPSGVYIPPHIVAHEEIHGRRQLAIGVDSWWDNYIRDLDFRYNEELLAHREEYRIACAGSRQVRRRALKEIAKRLCSPLYGSLVSEAEAIEDLQFHEKPDTVEEDVTPSEELT